MTKKDFELIAGVLKVVRGSVLLDANKPTVDYVIRAMASALSVQNPRFNRTRFIDACGVPS